MKIKSTLTIHPGITYRCILNLIFVSAAFAVLYLGSITTVRGDVSACPDPREPASMDIKMQRVTYYEDESPASGDLRAGVVDGRRIIRLRGWLYYYKPNAGSTVENAPVLIYNHGHDETRKEPCAIVNNFVPKGWVVFAPLRRGHSGSNIASTGVHTDDYVDNCVNSGPCSCNTCAVGEVPFCGRNGYEVNYIKQQVEDVREQIRYIRDRGAINTTGRIANRDKIAIAGHSFGGSLIVFANSALVNQNVAIDISGAELSWSEANPWWELELSCAMNSQQRPIYFLQPKNGRTLAPTRTLFGIAIENQYRSQAAIFRAAFWDSACVGLDSSCFDTETGMIKPEWEQAHGNFIVRPESVKEWAPSVREFINRYPR